MLDKIKSILTRNPGNDICKVCGKDHSDLSDIVALEPDYWADSYNNVPGNYLDDDLCVIREQDYFIKGIVQTPIIGTDRHFGWGVWISQKRENFLAYSENFRSSEIGPFFGWLSTEISYYKESTINLQTRACFRGNGLRPFIEIAPCDHEIYKSQIEGVTLKTAIEISHFYDK